MSAPAQASAWIITALLLTSSLAALAPPADAARADAMDAPPLADMPESFRAFRAERDGDVDREDLARLLSPESRHELHAQHASLRRVQGLDAPEARVGIAPHPAGGPAPTLLPAPTTEEPQADGVGARAAAATLSVSAPRVLALRVQFQPDADPCTATDGTFLPAHDDAFFEDLLADFVDYYEENSYGALSPEVDLSDVYTLPYTLPEYGFDFDFFGISYAILLYDAVQEADADVDFSEYDHVLLFHAGVGRESDVNDDSACDVHSAYLPPELIGWIMSLIGDVPGIPTNDDAFVVDATYMPETHDQDGITDSHILGVLAHEYGHQLGLPDLYDRDYSTVGGVGDWSIMGSAGYLDDGRTPAHFDAWSKIQLGWIEPTIVPSGTSLQTLRQAETHPDVILIPADGELGDRKPQEYFLVENRQKVGYDAFLPGSGLLIWHVDETVLAIDQNDHDTHRFLEVVEADGGRDLDTSYGDASDTWVSPLTFSDASARSSDNHAGLPSGVTISGISASSATMTATVSLEDALEADTAAPEILKVAGFGIGPGSQAFVYLEASDDREIVSGVVEIGDLTWPLQRFAAFDGYSWDADDFPEGYDSQIFFAMVEMPEGVPASGEAVFRASDGTNDATEELAYVLDLAAPSFGAWSVSERVPLPDEAFTVTGSITDDVGITEAYLYAENDEGEYVELPLTLADDGSFSISADLEDLSPTLVEGFYYLFLDAYDTSNYVYEYLGALWISEEYMAGPYIEILVGPENEENGYDASEGYVAKVNAFYDGEGLLQVRFCEFYGYTEEEGDLGSCYAEATPGAEGIVTFTADEAPADEVGSRLFAPFALLDGEYAVVDDEDVYDLAWFTIDLAPPTVELVEVDGSEIAEDAVIPTGPSTWHLVEMQATDDVYEADIVNYPADWSEVHDFVEATISYGAFDDWWFAPTEEGGFEHEILTSSRRPSTEVEIAVFDALGRDTTFEFALGSADIGSAVGKLLWKGKPLADHALTFQKDTFTIVGETNDKGAFDVDLPTGAWTLSDDLGPLFHLAAPMPVSIKKDTATSLTPVVIADFAGLNLKPVLPMGVDTFEVAIFAGDDEEPTETCIVEGTSIECLGGSNIFGDGLVALAPGAYDVLVQGEQVVEATVSVTLTADKVHELVLKPTPLFGVVALSVKNKPTEVPEATVQFVQDDAVVAECLVDVAEKEAFCEGAGTDGLAVKLKQGTYTYIAEAEDMKPLEKTVSVTGGKSTPLALSFVLAKAPVKVTLKTPAVTSYTLELLQGGESVGACAIDNAEKLADCDGVARAGTWPVILIEEGTFDVVATPGEAFADDYRAFEKKALKLVGGKGANLDVTFGLLKAPVTVTLKTREVAEFRFDLLDAEENAIGGCDVDASAKEMACDGAVSAGDKFPVILAPEGAYTVVATVLGAQEDDYKEFSRSATFVGGKAAKLDVTFALLKAPLTVTLKTKEVPQFRLAVVQDDAEIGACEFDADEKSVECEGDVSAGAKFPVVLVPEGAVTLVATPGGQMADDYKEFSKAMTLVGGKAAKADVKFTLLKAPLTLAFKAPLAESILLTFEIDGETIGECDVFPTEKTMDCLGDVSSSKYPIVLVPEGRVTLVATADDHDEASQTLTLVGGKSAKATITLVANYALLSVTLSNTDLEIAEFDLLDETGATVATCEIDVEAEEATCDSDEVWLESVDKSFVFHVPASGAAKWSAVFRAAGEQLGGAPDVVVSKLALGGGKTVAAKVTFKPNTVKVTVRGGDAKTADIELNDAEGRIYTATDKASATFTWVAAGAATVFAETDSGLTGEGGLTVVAGKSTSVSVTVS